MLPPHRSLELTGRDAERDALDQLVAAVCSGESRALVLSGEAGVGKTALMDHLAAQAHRGQVVRVSGVQSEMELAFAALHQVCAPALGLLDRVPAPQAEALRTVFGISAGPPPDMFLIGLGVLSLLAEAAVDQPLLCLVDDQQWLDRCSAQILSFVARRLGAESLGLVFATREVGPILQGLPEYQIGGLRDADARSLLDAVLTVPIDAQVRNQLVAEAHGNPLALLELPRGLTPAQLAGGFGLPGASGIEESFVQRVTAMPAETRRLLLLAAAEPSGDDALVRRAAVRLGIDPQAAAPATDAGLAEFANRIRFRHPLVRSAAYCSASAAEQREVHQALAAETDAEADPDRRAWHRAQGAAGPDEEIAEELERSAGRAQARSGFAATAAFLQRSAALTIDPVKRAGRALAAAQAELQTGAFDSAAELLAMAEGEQLSELQRARADLVHAQLAFLTNRGNDAPQLMLKAARRLEKVDVVLARTTYLDALSAAIFAGHLATPDGDVLAVAQEAAAAPQPAVTRSVDLLLEGSALYYRDGYAASAPTLHKALAGFGPGLSVEEELQLLWMAATTALRLWDADRWAELSRRHVQLVRQTGVLSDVALALTSLAYVSVFAGDLEAAASLTDEAEAANEVTGGKLAPYGRLALAAFRGDRSETLALAEATKRDGSRRGEGIGVAFADWASAVLANGLGRYQDALDAAQRSAEDRSIILVHSELVEAAVRTGAIDTAHRAAQTLQEMATATGTDWALGVSARCRAMVTAGETAEGLYREAITHLEKTALKVELARAQLLYGEWLRRERRRTDAREYLRTAHSGFEAMGLAGFADRARRELQAAGGTARKRVVPTRTELTAQEAQIARMARDGLSNPEIATRLFISARTVQYHLRKVFSKLEIASRSQLDQVLPR
ncbi:helix-turn-helix transcriptional regulator [Kribbella jiaozuonensis]|uniref:LuxR family transcriptional regulator n=1 Tax=Kribbella jiaozuonensis TaxID=2575441 RepID=A0A4U3LQD8_9ACTN|nr:LuxR family transcriptional regulator [Kribbella jiaozuonensis]TKK77912.1 LuxR family transcriptional regulator [Kribbella jiaozuonensis]